MEMFSNIVVPMEDVDIDVGEGLEETGERLLSWFSGDDNDNLDESVIDDQGSSGNPQALTSTADNAFLGGYVLLCYLLVIVPVELTLSTASESHAGSSMSTNTVLRGTGRGWVAGTPIELYGSQTNIDALAMKRKMSTGDHIDYILVYRLPKSQEDTEAICDALRKHEVNDQGFDGQTGRAFKRRAFLLGLSAVANIEEEVAEDNRTVFVKVHIPFDILKQQAQEIKLNLPLSEECLPVPKSHSNFDSLKSTFCGLPWFLRSWREPDVPELDDYYSGEFTIKKQSLFRDYTKPFKLFTEAQRTMLAHRLLSHCRYGDKPHQIGVARLVSNGGFLDAFPLHDGPYDDAEVEDADEQGHRHLLYRTWGQLKKFYLEQPLDHVREYFGEKIGIYFSWLGFYTTWLWFPSIFGIFVLLYGLLRFKNQTDAKELCESNIVVCPLCDSGCTSFALNTTCTAYEFAYVFDNEATVIFAFVMAIWSSIFLDYWKRQNAEVSYDWDVLDFEEDEPNRPEFVATVIKINPVTGLEEPSYHKKTKYLKYTTSFVTILFMLSLVIGALIGVIFYRLAVGVVLFRSGDSDEALTRKNASTITSVSAAAINLIVIIILNKIYGKIAVKLTDWENHKKQSRYEAHLAFKIFLFQFVNSFSSLFYIAFVKGQETGRPGDYNTFFGFRQDECPPYGCLLELTIQLAIIMVGKQTINNIREVLLPKMWACLFRRCKSNLLADLVLPWEKEFVELSVYPRMGLFYEYLEMIIQYGFVSLFVPAFPLAPLFALCNNILEIRVDSVKHVQHYRRPPALRAEDIGIWEQIMFFISYFSVLTNALIIAFTSNYLTKQVYMASYSSDGLEGYIATIYPPSPVTTGSDPDIMDCNYRSLRTPQGDKGQFYYEVLAAKVGFVIIFEHSVFLIKWVIQYLIPDVPKSVTIAIRREQYHATKALEQDQIERKTFSGDLTTRMNSSRNSKSKRPSKGI